MTKMTFYKRKEGFYDAISLQKRTIWIESQVYRKREGGSFDSSLGFYTLIS